MKFVDLPGVTGDVDYSYLNSVSDGIRNLRKLRAMSTAGDDGAVTIWVDDEGTYRGARYVYDNERSSIKTKTLRDMKIWLKSELPKIHR